MVSGDALGLFTGAIALGAVHGIEPGHGWPIAAAYALDKGNEWAYGFAASLVIGVGHLASSIAMVAVFFYAKDYFGLTQLNEPITVLGGVRIGGPVSLAAGVLLIALGVREYRHGHAHGGHDGGHGRDSVHSDRVAGHHHGSNTEHSHGDAHSHDHGHSHDDLERDADRGLLGIAWFAFVLGFAHEEEFEIIALCAGSTHCLELMSAYAITVVVGIVGLTMLLVAGYQHYEETVERYTPYLPVFSAAVLVVVGVGFIVGLF